VLALSSSWRRSVGALGLLLGLLGTAGPVTAATSQIDSLRILLKQPALADTARLQYLVTLSALLHTSDLATARRYAEEGVALAHRLGKPKLEVYALNNLAAMYYYTGDYPAAQRTFEATLKASRRAGLTSYTASAWVGLGNVAQELGNIPRALQHFEEARKAYAAQTPPNIDGQLLVLYNSGNAFNVIHESAKAARAFRRAQTLVGPGTNPHLRIKLLGAIASGQQEDGYLDSAQTSLATGLALAKQTQDLRGEAALRSQLAEIYLARKQAAQAYTEAARALTLARQVDNPFEEENALNLVATSLRALQRLDAYDTLRAYLTLHDTLFAQDRTDAIITAQTRFDVAGQQAQIRALEQQRRIAALEADRHALQTRWIVGWLAALVVGGATGLSWLYRRRQARHDAALRNRLAADLHDDVGALLSQIALQSDLLQEGLTPLDQQPAQWAEVAGSSRMAIRQLNDVVWSLDAHNDTVPDLLNRLRDYAHELLAPTGRDVRFRADDTLPTGGLPTTVRRNLYLIYKEAIHNILKHAPTDCCVTVSLSAAGEQLVLTVSNDTPGDEPPGPVRASGHGLRNIRERAVAMGGSATAERLADGGFSVQVSVPLKNASREISYHH
jgi:signal transduction histidine kinase